MIPFQNRSFAAFDLEIYKSVNNISNWIAEAPLFISCCAVASENPPKLKMWSQPRPHLEQSDARTIVRDLQHIAQTNTLLTWNGAAFDFHVLAIESDLYDECIELSMNHVDMMFLVYCIRGHWLGLDKALIGCGLSGKVHEVVLSTGQKITGMYGGMAPKLWQAGEYEAVLTYLKGDVYQPLELAHYIQENGRMDFLNFGGNTSMPCSLLSVQDACHTQNLQWKTNPPMRRKFLDWMFE